MAREDGRPKNPDSRRLLSRPLPPSLHSHDEALLASLRSPYPGEALPTAATQQFVTSPVAEIVPGQTQPRQDGIPSSTLNEPTDLEKIQQESAARAAVFRSILTGSELKVLVALISLPLQGRLADTPALLTEVWGEVSPETKNVLSFHLSHLRKKIKPAGIEIVSRPLQPETRSTAVHYEIKGMRDDGKSSEPHPKRIPPPTPPPIPAPDNSLNTNTSIEPKDNSSHPSPVASSVDMARRDGASLQRTPRPATQEALSLDPVIFLRPDRPAVVGHVQRESQAGIPITTAVSLLPEGGVVNPQETTTREEVFAWVAVIRRIASVNPDRDHTTSRLVTMGIAPGDIPIDKLNQGFIELRDGKEKSDSKVAMTSPQQTVELYRSFCDKLPSIKHNPQILPELADTGVATAISMLARVKGGFSYDNLEPILEQYKDILKQAGIKV